MAAPDLPTLYDFEDTLAAAFQTYLQAEMSGKTIQIGRNANQQTPPCILLRAEHEGAAAGLETDQKLFTTDGNVSKDRHFTGRIVTTIRTHRQADATDDDHADLRKRLRAAMYDAFKATAGLNAQLTYHSLRSLFEEGNSHDTEGDEGFDDTEITWAISYVIQDSAWPS